MFEVHHADVISIHFTNCSLDSKLAIYLKEHLILSNWLKNLAHLDLSNNNITDKWLESFKKIVTKRKNHTLKVLQMSNNQLGVYTGIQFPFIIRPGNLPLVVLTLDGNNITDQGVDTFYAGISQSNHLEYLDLSNNNLGDGSL